MSYILPSLTMDACLNGLLTFDSRPFTCLTGVCLQMQWKLQNQLVLLSHQQDESQSSLAEFK